MSISGFQDEKYIFFSFKDDYGTEFFSVKDAGVTFVLPKYNLANLDWYNDEFPCRYMYVRTNEESKLKYIDHDGEQNFEQWEVM